MIKFFEKKEILFAVMLIVVYVVGSSFCLNVSEDIGVPYAISAVFDLVLAVLIFAFVKKNGLMEYFGLCRSKVSAAKMLLYIPLFLVGGMGLFFGIGFQYEPTVMITHTVTMIFAGFLEEIIFRGFLFRAMEKNNRTAAIIVTSVTFGMGHIVNLIFNHYDIFDSLTQITYAVAVGFMLVFVLMRTGSLIPCIAFHIFNNAATAFTSGDVLIRLFGDEKTAELVLLSGMLLITLAYTLYVARAIPKREPAQRAV